MIKKPTSPSTLQYIPKKYQKCIVQDRYNTSVVQLHFVPVVVFSGKRTWSCIRKQSRTNSCDLAPRSFPSCTHISCSWWYDSLFEDAVFVFIKNNELLILSKPSDYIQQISTYITAKHLSTLPWDSDPSHLLGELLDGFSHGIGIMKQYIPSAVQANAWELRVNCAMRDPHSVHWDVSSDWALEHCKSVLGAVVRVGAILYLLSLRFFWSSDSSSSPGCWLRAVHFTITVRAQSSSYL